MIDWLWSGMFYTGLLSVLAAVSRWCAGWWWPLGPRTRRMVVLGLVCGVVAVVWAASSLPESRTTEASSSRLDAFAPVFHFRERHEIIVAAPQDVAFAAVRATTADEIALFQAFTWIRRLGRETPESILHAPAGEPLLDVAARTTFLRLADAAPHEVLLGTVVLAPAGFHRGEISTPDAYRELSRRGFVLATMNFRVVPLSASSSRVTTETRVFATDRPSLRRFTPYWRAIFPGSALLRMTWLRAIKRRAEAAAAIASPPDGPRI